MANTHTYDPSERVAIGKAARVAGVSIATLRRWEEQGRLKPDRTPGGQRRYRVGDVEALLTSSSGA